MSNFKIDLAIECIKSVIDNTKCVTCDKLIGPCVRFPCGHSVCEGCALRIGECLFCISSPASYVVDEPQTTQLINTAALVTAFEETFKIDVCKRQRISDQLRVEKLVFPECIQAPHKYSNKRKSLNSSFKNKENIAKKIPGEQIKSSDTVVMKKSAQYVQNWLNQHESIPQNSPRRPFGDISVNTQPLAQRPKQDILKLKKAQVNVKKSTYRIRSHSKSIQKTSSLLNKVVKSDSEIKNLQQHVEVKKGNNYVDSWIKHKCDKNESGIVLDDEPIVIDKDIDTNNIDKDKQAWLAVLEAAEKDEYEEKKQRNFKNKRDTNNSPDVNKTAGSILLQQMESKLPKNVLFYKKSSLSKTCKLCNDYVKPELNTSSVIDQSNELSIVINNSTFITTIKFTHCEGEKKLIDDKNSVAVQTDNNMVLYKDEMNNVSETSTPRKRKNMVDNNGISTKICKHDDISQSLDVFATNKDTNQDSSDNSLKRRKCVIIEDSDTDSNISCDNIHEVKVDVHRSSALESVECGILRTLSKTEYEQKTRRQVRGHTPNSSNSSDKENLDPNRRKKVKLQKKLKNKK